MVLHRKIARNDINFCANRIFPIPKKKIKQTRESFSWGTGTKKLWIRLEWQQIKSSSIKTMHQPTRKLCQLKNHGIWIRLVGKSTLSSRNHLSSRKCTNPPYSSHLTFFNCRLFPNLKKFWDRTYIKYRGDSNDIWIFCRPFRDEILLLWKLWTKCNEVTTR